MLESKNKPFNLAITSLTDDEIQSLGKLTKEEASAVFENAMGTQTVSLQIRKTFLNRVAKLSE